MHDLAIPGHYADEMAEEALQDTIVAREFDALLQTIDERLRCFWVKPSATSFDNPGRWHVGFFHSNPELRNYWVISTPDGSYSPPLQMHLDRLMAMDTWTGRMTYDRIVAARDAKAKERRKAFEEKRREFREKLLERLDSIHNVRISVPRAIPVAVERDRSLAIADASGKVVAVKDAA